MTRASLASPTCHRPKLHACTLFLLFCVPSLCCDLMGSPLCVFLFSVAFSTAAREKKERHSPTNTQRQE